MKKQKNKTVLILVDNPNRLKDNAFDEWYRTSISDKDGIFIGTGAGDQQLLKINNYTKELSQQYANNYGFQVTEGVSKLVKLIEFEKIVEEDEDE